MFGLNLRKMSIKWEILVFGSQIKRGRDLTNGTLLGKVDNFSKLSSPPMLLKERDQVKNEMIKKQKSKQK